MINKIKNNKNNQGQIAIIVLLASAVLLTLGLSSSRKTITDTKVDTDEELLKEAFNAAESGINNYLNTTNTTYDAGSGNSAVVSSTNIGNAISLSSEGKVVANTPQLFWLVNHNDDGTIGNTYYSSATANLTVDTGYNGALKIDYFYIESGVYKIRRLGCNYGSNVVDGFDSNTATCSSLTLSGSPILVVVTPLGSSTALTISGSSPFPIQGQELTAVGTAGDGVTTQIKTRNIYQLPPFFFDSMTAQNVVQ